MASHPQEGLVETSVIIVGGGACGLSLSIFLAAHGIDHFLFEKHPSTSILPKAHYINQRTMEIFRQHGVVESIRTPGCPIHNMGKVDWRTSLGGEEPWEGKVLGYVPSFGGLPGTPDYEAYRSHSAELSCNLPLSRSEPVLRRIAEERSPGRVLFSHRVIDFAQDSDGVVATIEDPSGKRTKYRAPYMVGADGGKTVGPKLGIEMEGPKNLVDYVSAHFKADLSQYWDDRSIITHFINPEGDFAVSFNSGAIVANGPTWGRHSEEWVIYMNFPVTEDNVIDAAAVPDRIRDILKLPGVDIEVLQLSNWSLEKTLATRYGEGRIFLAGDAAHKRPPTTGLGLNTSVEDAMNLSWKLALVLKGKADPSLLNTYEIERRPVARRNCDWALFTFLNFSVIQAAVGMPPGQREKNIQRARELFEDSERGAINRRQLQQIISTQDIEYAAHNIEIGFIYDDGALVSDGTPRPEQDLRGRIHKPTTRPGHRLPHAWLEKDGKVVSTHDLIGNGAHDFLLITDEAGDSWVEAAKKISKISGLSIATAGIMTYRHLKRPDLYLDQEDTWMKVREILKGGALLVRQDNFVAWRHSTPSSRPAAELSSALQKILGKEIHVN